MKKITVSLSVAALVVAAYVGSAWYVGKQAETAIARAIEQTNERVIKMLGPDLSSSRFNIQIREYQRGIFSSEAQYAIQTVDSTGEPMEYIVQDHLQHGPFSPAALGKGIFRPLLAYSQAEMVVTPAIQEWFDPAQGTTPLSIETQVGLGGRGTSQWVLSPIEMSRSDRHFSFSGGHIHVVFSNGFNTNVATGHFDIYALTDKTTGEKIDLRDIRLNGTSDVTANGQFDHHSQVQIKTLTISDESQADAIVLEDVSADLSSQQRASLLDLQLRYDFARILLAGSDLGQLSIGVALKQLDTDALADFQLTYAAMAEQRGPDTRPGFALTSEEQHILQEKLRPVLASGLTLSLDPVVWKNTAGQSQASLYLALRDPGETTGVNALQLLRDVISNAKIEVDINRSMVVQLFQQVGALDNNDPTQAGEQAGQLFDEYAELLAQLGLISHDGNTVSLSLDAFPSNDKVTLNGETMTTEQLMMLALGLLFLQ